MPIWGWVLGTEPSSPRRKGPRRKAQGRRNLARKASSGAHLAGDGIHPPASDVQLHRRSREGTESGEKSERASMQVRVSWRAVLVATDGGVWDVSAGPSRCAGPRLRSQRCVWSTGNEPNPAIEGNNLGPLEGCLRDANHRHPCRCSRHLTTDTNLVGEVCKQRVSRASLDRAAVGGRGLDSPAAAVGRSASTFVRTDKHVDRATESGAGGRGKRHTLEP